jgi:hypothetical protein
MKTAIQELIYELDFFKNILWKADSKNESILVKDIIRKAVLKLEKEKEQISIAYDRGYKACDLDEALEINKTMFSGERYYEQTYNQNK